jgi:hypothetical protein
VMKSRRLMPRPQAGKVTLYTPRATLCATANDPLEMTRWVKSGRDALKFRCPLYPRKRTSVSATTMSAMGHKPTFAPAAKLRLIRSPRRRARAAMAGPRGQALWRSLG